MAGVGASAEFAGNDRYEVVRRVGGGAMGVVYEVVDRSRDETVALKALRRTDPAWLYQFKQEFRALADVSHPNLVALHELVSDGDEWFFTMELVDGVDLLRHIRGASSPTADTADSDALAETVAPPPEAHSVASPGLTDGEVSARATAPATSPAAIARLRAAFAQLAQGVDALHRAGKLHRDIKPSNVLVTGGERVVLLDFGLVVEQHRNGGDDGQVVGTPAYMSPEQAAGGELDPASDWYSVGVVLFEALTGQLPFTGSHLTVLTDKQRTDAPAPRDVAPNVPDDLDELCRGLLARDPAARPSGNRVLRVLGVAPTDASPAALASSLGEVPLVGREDQLAVLRDAMRDVSAARAASVFVSGASGMGKSTLVRRFLDELEAAGALVLAGRCYERESVPYKAVDALIDALSRALRRMSDGDVRSLVTPDAVALGRLFPVLWRVDAIARLRRQGLETRDPQELRRRAFHALRTLLARLARRVDVCLFVDDLQWGDLDSAALLNDVLRPPDAPPVLLVGAYRAEGADAPLVRALLDPGYVVGDAPPRHTEVGPLSRDDAARLAEELGAAHQADAIAVESGGNPYFVAELARAAGDADVARAPASLDGVLWARIQTLAPGPRRLLELIAVAGRPIGRAAVARAAEAGADERQSLAVLSAAHLVRTAGARDRDALDTYHDRIRETVLSHLDEDAVAARHLALALALEASDEADPEAMAMHYAAGGDAETAARYAGAAATRAAEALAFDRASRLYRLTMELSPGADHRELNVRLADALANAGRGGEAADAYLAACDGATPGQVLDLKRHAAEQYLVSGYVERGLDAVADVLGEVGMKLPRTRRGAVASLLARRASLRLRGRGYKQRAADEIAPDKLRRIDVCWSAAIGLTFIDNLRAAVFQSRYLQLALAAGEPNRVALGYALEAGLLTTLGSRTRDRATDMLDLAEEIGQELDNPHVLGLVELIRGVAPQYDGRWREALSRYRTAVEIFRDRCRGVNFEITSALVWAHVPLYYMGEVVELSRLLPELLEQGRERGNHYMTIACRTGLANAYWLFRDDPDGALASNAAAMETWSAEGVHMMHYDMLARVQRDLYVGNAEDALSLATDVYPQLKKAGLFRLQRVRIEATHVRARAAIARGTDEDLAAADRDTHALEAEHLDWSSAVARLQRACISAARGEADAAVGWLRAAESGFRAREMHLYEQVARRRRGQLIGGGHGERLVREADRAMTEQTIVRPDRIADVLAPGFDR